jgi:hypothetical protein
MKILAMLTLVLLASCGGDEKTMQTPEPGKSASCITYEVDGTIYHKCITGDGLETQTQFKKPSDGKDGINGIEGPSGADGKDGKDGIDGKDALLASASCQLDWETSPSSKIKFNLQVNEYSTGVSAMFLSREYKAGEYSRVVYLASAMGEDKDKVMEDGLFTVSYSDCAMKIVQGGEEPVTKVVDCKCQGGE